MGRSRKRKRRRTAILSAEANMAPKKKTQAHDSAQATHPHADTEARAALCAELRREAWIYTEDIRGRCAQLLCALLSQKLGDMKVVAVGDELRTFYTRMRAR